MAFFLVRVDPSPSVGVVRNVVIDVECISFADNVLLDTSDHAGVHRICSGT